MIIPASSARPLRGGSRRQAIVDETPSPGWRLFGFDDFPGDLRNANAAFLAFDLELPMSIRLAQVQALHEDALGPLDQLAGFQSTGKFALLLEQSRVFREALGRHHDL